MATFKPRLTKPEKGNPYYNTKSNGGYSSAIKGKPTDPDCDVLSNCVGYAYGRFNEIGGWGSCKYLVPTNAEKFIQYKGSLEVGQTPKLGACMVWQKGATLSGNDGAGHVAIVEQVISSTEVLTSESAWGGGSFWTANRKKGDGNWGGGSGYTFLGFIYNPAECCKDAPVANEDASCGIKPVAGKVEKGDIVNFTGSKHYKSSSADTGSTCKPGKATVTSIAQNGKHPYHLIKVAGGGSTVYGWVDAADIEGLVAEPVKPAEQEKPAEPTPPPVVPEPSPVTPWEPAVSDIVQFNGGAQYSNSNASTGSTAKAGQAKITKIVPGKKHPYHLVRTGKTGPYGWVDRDTFEKV